MVKSCKCKRYRKKDNNPRYNKRHALLVGGGEEVEEEEAGVWEGGEGET